MLDVRQNTFQGQNLFPHMGNQFWGQFNGVFAGDGTRITNVTASGFPNPLPAGTFAGANSSGTQLGTSAKPVIFYGVFHGVGTGAFIGDGTSLTGIPQLGATQTWTGNNTWTDTANVFNPGPLYVGDNTATDPAIWAYGQISSIGAIYAGNSSPVQSASTLAIGAYGFIISTGDMIAGDYPTTGCYLQASTGDIAATNNVYAVGGEFVGSPKGLTDFRAGPCAIAGGQSGVTVTFSSPVSASTYSVALTTYGAPDSSSGVIYVSSKGTSGFVIASTATLITGQSFMYTVWPEN